MSYSVGYPINFVAGGDTTSQAIAKFINEFTRLYGYLNTEAAKIPADASGLDVTDSGGYFTAEDVEGILQEIGALLATLGDLATEDVVDEDLLSLSDVTTGNASSTKHGLLPKLPDDSGKALLGDGSWGTIASSLYIHVVDKKAAGTNGGSSTSGSWQKRTLNTVVTDETGEVTLSSDKISLPAGTYLVHASAPFKDAGELQIRLYNASDSAVVLYGTSEYQHDACNVGRAFLFGKFTLAASKELQLEYRCAVGRSTFGLGADVNFGGDELYSDVQLWKVA